MSGTIEAIERHIPSRPRPAGPPVRSADWTDSSRGELGLQPSAPSLIAKWQQRGPETFSGHAFYKLRLTLAPAQPAITTSAVG
jgi:hypothetical protein